MTQLSADERAVIRAGLLAGRASDRFRAALARANDADFLDVSVEGVAAPVPVESVRQFIEMLDDTSEGRAVTVAPAELLVGTSEAARLLGVSRTWVARLVDEGKLPSTLRGSKRRIPLGALIRQRRWSASRMRTAVEAFDDADHGSGKRAPAVTTGVLVGGDVHYAHVDAERSYYLEALKATAHPVRRESREPAYAA